MKQYTIIGGINGVGKSSLTGVLKDSRTDLGIIIDVDKITAELSGNLIAGGKAALRKISSCLERGVSFTQETTLSGYKTERTARQARDAGYTVRLYYVALDSAEESLLRIQNRVNHGGHNIDPDAVFRRFRQRWESLSAVLPYCDEAVFFDNSNGFQKVAEYSNGELRRVGNFYPLWLSQFSDYFARQNEAEELAAENEPPEQTAAKELDYEPER